jgi:antitoxin (DNA-binding transcriptional repressor) of toxin-antitoxin stability system
MTQTIALETLTATLPELLDMMLPGDEIILTRNHQPVARLVPEAAKPTLTRREPGSCKGMVKFMAPDFDAPLDDFKEYM